MIKVGVLQKAYKANSYLDNVGKMDVLDTLTFVAFVTKSSWPLHLALNILGNFCLPNSLGTIYWRQVLVFCLKVRHVKSLVFCKYGILIS